MRLNKGFLYLFIFFNEKTEALFKEKSGYNILDKSLF